MKRFVRRIAAGMLAASLVAGLLFGICLPERKADALAVPAESADKTMYTDKKIKEQVFGEYDVGRGTGIYSEAECSDSTLSYVKDGTYFSAASDYNTCIDERTGVIYQLYDTSYAFNNSRISNLGYAVVLGQHISFTGHEWGGNRVFLNENDSYDQERILQFVKDGTASGKHVIIPDTVEYRGENYKVIAIAEGAFYGNRNIESLDMSACRSLCMKSIHYRNSDGEMKIAFPFKGIGGYAFAYASNLEKVLLPSGIRNSYGNYAVDHEDANKITYYNGLAIKACLFAGTGIASIDLDASAVYWVSYGAFAGCQFLSDVTFSDELTQISSYAFTGCSNLAVLDFTKCKKLQWIYEGAFYKSGLRSVDLSATSVSSLDNYIFMECECLEYVKMPQNLTNIGYRAFYDDAKLKITEDSFPKTLKIINGGAFYNVGKAYDTENPETEPFMVSLSGSATIGEEAFKNAYIGTVEIADDSKEGKCVTIGKEAFAGSCLQKMYTDDYNAIRVKIQDRAFMDCMELNSFFEGSGNRRNFEVEIMELGAGAFQGTSSLQYLCFDDFHVGAIPQMAFAGSGIKGSFSQTAEGIAYTDRIRISDSITEIGERAFYLAEQEETDITLRFYFGEESGLETLDPDIFGHAADNAWNPDISWVVFYCYPCSAAETYAEANGIEYHLLAVKPEPPAEGTDAGTATDSAIGGDGEEKTAVMPPGISASSSISTKEPSKDDSVNEEDERTGSLQTPRIISYKADKKLLTGKAEVKCRVVLKVNKKKYTAAAGIERKFKIKLKKKLKNGDCLKLKGKKNGTASRTVTYKVKKGKIKKK